MSASRDIIQISLGPSANALTAHLLNLQGLAATSSAEESAVCDPQTTHAVQNNFWVPRAILVDEAARCSVVNGVPSADSVVSTWSGGVETFDQSWSHPESKLADFFQTASNLAFNSHSRYYKEPQQQNTYKFSSSNSRHVVWDDNEEEDEEDPEDRARRQERDKSQWETQTQAPLQETLTELWRQAPVSELTWTDYLMPPYSQRSKVALPYSSQSKLATHWDQYQSTQELDRWKEEELSERLRHLLEDCDYCQGFTIATEGYGIYAGLTTSLLQEIQGECKSAGRIVFHVTNPRVADSSKESIDENGDPSSPSWQEANVERVRKHVQSGLALHGFTQNANLVIPLRHEESMNTFASSARLAIALESATLPFRLQSQSDPRYKIGLQNAPFYGQGGGDIRWGSTAQRLNFAEYITCLQPSSQYMMLELERLSSTNDNIWEHLKLGTSIERDQRTRDDGRDAQNYRPRDVPPGRWLQNNKHGGILDSSSFEIVTDRTLHHHFALSTSFRPVALTGGKHDIPDYMTCMVEGMGIQYRPERSMCTVLNQSFSQLTDGGYGAGTYWKSIQHNVPVLAVLGNTTRVYPYLSQISSEMKLSMGQRNRGYINRDVVSGVLPESEDCEEALAYCFDVRDAYHPPDGSGLTDVDFHDEFEE